jgi:two-component system cell cycle response regulator
MKKDQSQQRKVLVIDDSEVNLKLLNVILSKDNLQVHYTGNSLDALPMALQYQPDLILLDVMMPGISGLEILRLLKANNLTSSVPVLMVTARTKGEDVREALEAGAFDYVKKPLDEVEILARVHSALRYKDDHDRLLELSMRDALTGLYNHRLLMDLLDREMISSVRKKHPTCFCMADIDHFKSINDTFGHPVGDYILQEVSRLLTAGVRKSDTVGRYGGEEFGLVLGGCDLEAAKILCERLRQKIMEHKFVFEGQAMSITLSLGLAEYLPDATFTGATLVKWADEALYEAKRSGRNQLKIAQIPNPVLT